MRAIGRLVPETAATLYVGTVVLLTAVGLVMIYSATAFEGGTAGSSSGLTLFEKQAVWTLIAGGVMLVFTRVDYRWLGRIAGWLLLGLLVMLFLVLLPDIGTQVKGARRWFRLGSLSFQPSEIAKLVVVLFVARYLVVVKDRIQDFRRGALPLLGIIGFVTFLVAIEPDLGTSLFIAASALAMSIVGGLRVRHVAPLLLVSIPLLFVFMMSKFDHVSQRLVGFVRPMDQYQLKQSLIALGSGGWAGVGLGSGREKLYFLPERTSDFIFSLLGEEMGFLGTTLVLFLFLFLVTLGIRIALEARDRFGFYLAVGITILVGLQAVTNVAVVTASVPTKGISLPFISAGGSLLVTLYAGAGILVSIARASEREGSLLASELGSSPEAVAPALLADEEEEEWMEDEDEDVDEDDDEWEEEEEGDEGEDEDEEWEEVEDEEDEEYEEEEDEDDDGEGDDDGEEEEEDEDEEDEYEYEYEYVEVDDDEEDEEEWEDEEDER